MEILKLVRANTDMIKHVSRVADPLDFDVDPDPDPDPRIHILV